jgi:hypothetical protein
MLSWLGQQNKQSQSRSPRVSIELTQISNKKSARSRTESNQNSKPKRYVLMATRQTQNEQAVCRVLAAIF